MLIESFVGPLGFDAEGGEVTALHWGRAGSLREGLLAEQVRDEVGEYLRGARERFDVPVRIAGTPFQRAFLQALVDIPYGATRTYGDLAVQLDVSAQAIGQACGANPIAVLIPCHRILAANGLGGYSGQGGVEAKVKLLRHEGAAGLLI